MTTENKRYLGDGVYVQPDIVGLKLTAEDDLRAMNTIYLEHQVLLGRVAYAVREWPGFRGTIEALLRKDGWRDQP